MTTAVLSQGAVPVPLPRVASRKQPNTAPVEDFDELWERLALQQEMGAVAQALGSFVESGAGEVNGKSYSEGLA